MPIQSVCALLVAVALCSCAARPGVPPEIVEHQDWGHHFRAAGVAGTMVLMNEPRSSAGAAEPAATPAPGRMLVYNPRRAASGYLPASTFKILNALIGLETGVVDGPDTLFPWDGVRRNVAAWNGDLTLRQAFQVSAVPVYQEVARRIGAERMAWYVRACGYGNADIGGAPLDLFWLSGNLRISALEQVAFLRRLFHGQLPFAAGTMETVKDMMLVERGPGWTLRAKSGWAVKDAPGIGWWVGWLERDAPHGSNSQDGPNGQGDGNGEVWFFALNVDIAEPGQLGARQAVVTAVLREMGLL